jgi:hypothetical protein
MSFGSFWSGSRWPPLVWPVGREHFFARNPEGLQLPLTSIILLKAEIDNFKGASFREGFLPSPRVERRILESLGRREGAVGCVPEFRFDSRVAGLRRMRAFVLRLRAHRQ